MRAAGAGGRRGARTVTWTPRRRQGTKSAMDHYRFTATRSATWDEEMTCATCGWAGVVSAAGSATASSSSVDGGRMADAPHDAAAAAQSASMLAARIAPCPRCGASGRARAAHLRGSVFVLMLTTIAGAASAALRGVSSVAFWILLVLGVIFALVALTRLVFWSTVKKDVRYVERTSAASSP